MRLYLAVTELFRQVRADSRLFISRVGAFCSAFFRGRIWATVLFQALLVCGCLMLAWFVRFDFTFPNSRLMLSSLPVLLVTRLIFIKHYNLLHGWWRYTGINDALDVVKAVTAGSVGFLLVFRFVIGQRHFPLSVYAIEMILTGTTLCGVRIISRLLAESPVQNATTKRLLLIGAGQVASMVIRETRQSSTGYIVVGCVDDDITKQGAKIYGVLVLGTVDQLGEVAKRVSANEVLIAVASAKGSQMLRFAETCEAAGMKFRTVPPLNDWIAGKQAMAQIREFALEDLLGREPVKTNLGFVLEHIQKKVVMVTGAAGSIGSELCRQVLLYSPARLLCVDQSETGIFYLELELSKLKPGCPIFYSVTDVGDPGPMRKLFSDHHVDIVFHAAAYKHVPLMESNVQQAINNNVFGLLKLLDVADEGYCKTFVLISSDKAVNPTSIMGASKRICELIVGAWPAAKMRCVAVRFGNVLGSNGSIIPLFQRQLSNNQPLTVTHPEIKRFFMTIREAVSLVLQACVLGTHRDVLVLDMGEPIRILDLARMLIALSGKSHEQVGITFIGLRKGEKMVEELFYASEEPSPTSSPRIKRARADSMNWLELRGQLAELQASMSVDGADPIRRKVKEIVPEYSDLSQTRFTLEPPEVASSASAPGDHSA